MLMALIWMVERYYINVMISCLQLMQNVITCFVQKIMEISRAEGRESEKECQSYCPLHIGFFIILVLFQIRLP